LTIFLIYSIEFEIDYPRKMRFIFFYRTDEVEQHMVRSARVVVTACCDRIIERHAASHARERRTFLSCLSRSKRFSQAMQWYRLHIGCSDAN
jgi:hypothetical protein